MAIFITAHIASPKEKERPHAMSAHYCLLHFFPPPPLLQPWANRSAWGLAHPSLRTADPPPLLRYTIHLIDICILPLYTSFDKPCLPMYVSVQSVVLTLLDASPQLLVLVCQLLALGHQRLTTRTATQKQRHTQISWCLFGLFDLSV